MSTLLSLETLELLAAKVPDALVKRAERIRSEQTAAGASAHLYGVIWRLSDTDTRHTLAWWDVTGALTLSPTNRPNAPGAVDLGRFTDRDLLEGAVIDGWAHAIQREGSIEWLIDRIGVAMKPAALDSGIRVAGAREALARRPRRATR